MVFIVSRYDVPGYHNLSLQDTFAITSVASAIDFMSESYADSISLKILAEHTSLPVHTFRRAFKKMTGCTPINYLIRLRIEKSVEMMEENNKLCVIDVAMSNGFENSSYFTLKFKEIMGVTPIKYLKKIAKQVCYILQEKSFYQPKPCNKFYLEPAVPVA